MIQINLISPRITRLKKLFHISIELIHEFGFTYFLRIAFEEFSKQKWKLFDPDTISSEIKNEFIVDYNDFLENLQLEKNLYKSKNLIQACTLL